MINPVFDDISDNSVKRRGYYPELTDTEYGKRHLIDVVSFSESPPGSSSHLSLANSQLRPYVHPNTGTASHGCVVIESISLLSRITVNIGSV